MNERIPQVDGLRWFAFLMVFLHHAFPFPLGWAGVDLFFVMSGYLITSILLRNRDGRHYFSKFYLRRTFRILPVYYLFLILDFTYFEPKLTNLWPWYFSFTANFRDAWLHQGAKALSPTWSLCVEEQFYLIWPLVVFLAPRKRLGSIVAAIMILVPLARAVATFVFSHHYPIYVLLPFRADLLAGGSGLCLLEQSSPKLFKTLGRPFLAVFASAATIFALLTVTFSSFRTGANGFLFNVFGFSLIMLLCTSALGYLLTLNRGFFYRFFSFSLFRYLGQRSYSMYLMHQLILSIAWYFAGDYPQYSRHLLAATPTLILTIALAMISWTLFEEPMLWLGRRVEKKLFPLKNSATVTEVPSSSVPISISKAS